MAATLTNVSPEPPAHSPPILPSAATPSSVAGHRQTRRDASSSGDPFSTIEVNENVSAFLFPPTQLASGALWQLRMPAPLEASNLLLTHPYNCMPHQKRDEKFPSQVRHENLPFLHLAQTRARNSNVKDYLPLWVSTPCSRNVGELDSLTANEPRDAGAIKSRQSLYTVSDSLPLALLQPMLLRSDGTLDHVAPQMQRVIIVHFTSHFPNASTDEAHAEYMRVYPCLRPDADNQWWGQQLKDARPKTVGGVKGGSKRSRNRSTRDAQDESSLKSLILHQLGVLARNGHVPLPSPGSVFWLAHVQSMPLCDPCHMPSVAQTAAAGAHVAHGEPGQLASPSTPPPLHPHQGRQWQSNQRHTPPGGDAASASCR